MGSGQPRAAVRVGLALGAEARLVGAFQAPGTSAASRDGRLGITVECTSLPLAHFSAAAAASDNTALYGARANPSAPVYVDGAVFELENVFTHAPTAELLLTHPKPGACAWIEEHGKGRLVVGLNTYGRFETQDSDAATVQIAAPFTSLVPPTIVSPALGNVLGFPTIWSIAGPGIMRATSKYFGPQSGPLEDRWPTGVFSLLSPAVDDVLVLTALGPQGAELPKDRVIEALRGLSALLTKPKWSLLNCCNDESGSAGKSEFPAKVDLDSLTANLCSGPSRYVRMQVTSEYLYAMTRGGSAKRRRLGN